MTASGGSVRPSCRSASKVSGPRRAVASARQRVPVCDPRGGAWPLVAQVRPLVMLDAIYLRMRPSGAKEGGPGGVVLRRGGPSGVAGGASETG